MNNISDAPQILSPQGSKEEVIRLLERYPLPLLDNGKVMTFKYGTAGFRYDAKLLEGVMVRVGILAACRADTKSSSVGLMVTASHNDESYNGIKLADPNGGMMESDGEALAVDLANAGTVEDVLKLVPRLPLHTATDNKLVIVHMGHDTRVHSPALTNLAVRAAQAMGATIYMHGVVTTPQLHYCTMMDNPQFLPKLLLPPKTNVSGYYVQLATAYMGLISTKDIDNNINDDNKPPLIVDCACGVGFPHLRRLNEVLTDIMGDNRRLIVPRNAPGEGPLNEQCGSEFVQKERKPPTWYGSNDDDDAVYAASLDGDSDRIVFFSKSSKEDDLILLDGDKIAVLICLFLKQQLSQLESDLPEQQGELSLEFGVVQTAYANGSSTNYLKELPIPVKIAKTGVKYVHKAAHENFDIGVYFEANGHGTVLFGEKFYNFIDLCDMHLEDAENNVALKRLKLLPKMINQAVGDALSDLLLVDAILQLQNNETLQGWNSLYTDLPSKQSKVAVPDRTMISMNDNETACLAPMALQQDLNNAIMDGARCFVRPSGTENVVRIYAEAPTTEEANKLAGIAADLIVKHCCKENSDKPSSYPPSRSKM